MDAFDTSLNRRPRAVGLKIAVILLVLLAIAGAWAGAYYWAKYTGQLKRVEHIIAQYDYGWPSWMSKGAKKATYTEDKSESNGVMVSSHQTTPVVASQKPQTVVNPAATPPPQPPKAIKRPPLGFISHDRKAITGQEDTYELAPGATKLSCITETAINSDVPGVFTAKVSRGIWDSATGRHLLIPQGSTILGQYHSETLLFGNERVPTTSLTLALPNGNSVDLGHAPVTDQLGINGLTGRVNSHWFRNIGAVLIMGVLRGGQQVVQTELAQQNGATVVVGGVASAGNQFAQQRLGRAIDSRPTIEIDAGQPCTVILMKPLRLAAAQ